MTRHLVTALLRGLADNWSPQRGHYHVAAAGRVHPCADPACPRH